MLHILIKHNQKWIFYEECLVYTCLTQSIPFMPSLIQLWRLSSLHPSEKTQNLYPKAREWMSRSWYMGYQKPEGSETAWTSAVPTIYIKGNEPPELCICLYVYWLWQFVCMFLVPFPSLCPKAVWYITMYIWLCVGTIVIDLYKKMFLNIGLKCQCDPVCVCVLCYM